MIPLSQWLASRLPPVIATGAGSLEGSPPQVSVEQACEEAYERGRSEADAMTQTLLQAAIAKERRDHAAALAEARAHWCETEALAMTGAIADAMASIHDALATAAARAIADFLDDAAQARAIASFRAALNKIGEDAELVRVEGPQDLIAALGELPAGVTAKVSDAVNLRAVAGETHIESGLAQWRGALRELQP